MSSVQSVDRIFDLIEALSLTPRGMTLTDLSQAVSLHKSTTHRLLTSLIDNDYVMKDAESGKYRLTLHLFEIGGRILGGMNILSVARPYLEKLSETTNEAVHLAVREGTEIVYLYKDDPYSTVHMASRVGLRSPLYCTGLGKSILAYLPEAKALELWNRSNIERFTPNTITTFARMQHEMALIREKGYAVDNEEHELGIRCIGVVVKDYSNGPVGAISVSATAVRLNDAKIEEFAPLAISAASNISRLLGCTNY